MANDLNNANESDTNSYDDQAIRKVRDLIQSSPDAIGPYRILEKLGAGGMGEVYRCEQRQPIRREVALKLIKLGMDTKQIIARFSAERQALAMMDHPNIAKVFDAGTDDTGRPFFVMEYVKGKPITDYADDKKLTLDDRLKLFQQVCNAIQHAHHKGVIHRDLKPSNVLVSTQDGRPHAKVIDFGIAKAMNQPLTDMTLFTEHALLIGTPAYMSPEQAEGSIDIDTRSDVYSLGVLLYELLTGFTPFDPQRLKKAALMEVARIIRDEEPPKPSTRISSIEVHPETKSGKSNNASPLALSSGKGVDGEVNPAFAQNQLPSKSSLASLAKSRSLAPESYAKHLRGELDWIVMKSLEKDRKRRYSSPEDFAQDIERHLEGTPIEAAPPDLRYRTQKFVKKHKTVLVGASVVASLLVLALAGTLIGLVQARRSLVREQIATAKETKAREDAEFQAYIANIGAAQVAMQGESWPEARQRLKACPDSLRGWEWHFLNAKASAPEFGFAEAVTEVQLSNNDRYIICRSGYDGKVIDVQSRQRISNFRAKPLQKKSGSKHPYKRIGPSAVLPDGTGVFASGSDIIFVPPRGDEGHRAFALNEETFASVITVSPNGGFIVVGFESGDKSLVVDTVTLSTILALKPKDEILGWSTNEKFISAIETNEAVWVYSTETGKAVGSFRTPGKMVQSSSLTADGSILAVGTDLGTIELFDTAKGTAIGSFELQTPPSESKSVNHLMFTPDSKSILAVTGGGNQLSIVDTTTKKTVSTRRGEFYGDSRFTADGGNVVSLSDGSIWNWKLDTSSAALSKPFGKASIAAFSKDASFAVSVDDYRVRVWMRDKPNLQPLATSFDSERRTDGIRCGRFGGRELYLSEWSPATMDAVTTFVERNLTPGAGTHALAKNGNWTVTADEGNRVVINDDKSKRMVAQLIGHEASLRVAAFSPDGRRLVTGSDDYTVRFWNTANWREVAVSRHSIGVTDLAFTKDGTRLVVGFADKSVESWDVRSFDQRKRDLDSEREQTGEASKIVDELLAKQIAWKDLAESILSTPNLSPAVKVGALGELNRRLGAIRSDAATRLTLLKSELFLKANVEQAMQAAEIPTLVRKAMANEVLSWSEEKAELIKMSHRILFKTKGKIEHYRIAQRINELLLKDDPGGFGAWKDLGIARYRVGEYQLAIDALAKAEELGAKQLRKITEVAPALAYSAMARFQLGDTKRAKTLLDKALDKFGLLEQEVLRNEAIAMINPKLGTPSMKTKRVLDSETIGAINAEDEKTLETLRGEQITVFGTVTSIAPTVSRTAFTIYLDGYAFSVFVRPPLGPLVNDATLSELNERKIVIQGRLDRHDNIDQINLRDWSQLAIAVSTEEMDKWTKSQALVVAEPPERTDIAPSIQALREAVGKEKTVAIRVRAAGGDTNLYLNSLEDFRSIDCFTIKITADQAPFFKDMGIDAPRIELVDKIVSVRGTVESLENRLSIVVKNLKDQLRILDENGSEWIAIEKEIASQPTIPLAPLAPQPPPSKIIQPLPTNGIKIMAWNVESGKSEVTMISQQIAVFSETHIFGFSEVDPRDFDVYLKAVDEMDPRSFKSVNGQSGNDIRLQTVYDADRLELLESIQPMELAGTVVNDGNHRSPLICLFNDKVTNKKFYTVMVHQARGKEDLRNVQAKGLREWARDKSIAVVAMGDFNFDFDIIKGNGNASFEALRRDNILSWVRPEVLIESNWTDTNQDLRNDFPNSILDGFFVSGPAKEWQPKSRIIVRPGDFPDDDTTSDHRPSELVFVPQ